MAIMIFTIVRHLLYISAGVGLGSCEISNNTIPVGFDINETLSASKITLRGAGIGAKNML